MEVLHPASPAAVPGDGVAGQGTACPASDPALSAHPVLPWSRSPALQWGLCQIVAYLDRPLGTVRSWWLATRARAAAPDAAATGDALPVPNSLPYRARARERRVEGVWRRHRSAGWPMQDLMQAGRWWLRTTGQLPRRPSDSVDQQAPGIRRRVEHAIGRFAP